MKKIIVLTRVISILNVTIMISGSVLITYYATKYNTRKEVMKEVGIDSKTFFSTNERITYIPSFNNKYSSFIDDEKAEYICRLSKDFKVNSDLVVALLEKENPTLAENATSAPNLNETRDLGLFQLNDKSLYCKGGFLELWWKEEFGEFNANNWKHNTYIAVKYIQDLTETFGENNIYFIAAGYNAGIPRAYDAYINDNLEKLPSITANNYAPTVETNYNKWRLVTSGGNT